MAPKKKIKVVESEQSSPPSDCSSSAKKEEDTLSVAKPDLSLLPPELLHLISKCFGDSFDAVLHARSVCNSWRSAFPYPSSVLSRNTYTLPAFDNDRGYCTLLNFPVFLFIHRDRTSLQSEFLIGGIVREDRIFQLPSSSPVQCTVKVKFPWSDPTSINVIDYRIVSLGRQYVMVGYDRESLATQYRGAAFLPLTKKGRGEFVVLLGYKHLLALTSAEMRWKRLEHGSRASCSDIVTFRGRFYAVLLSGELFVIDPYSLEVTPLMPPPLELENCGISRDLVPSGDDELYLVEKISPRNVEIIRIGRSATRVSRLDEETGEWVVLSDVGGRVLLIGPPGNRTCSGKDLPDGCGLSGNSILQTDMGGSVTYTYKYGVDTRHEEDFLDLNYWRSTQQNRVTIVSASPNPVLMNSPVVSLRVERRS